LSRFYFGLYLHDLKKFTFHILITPCLEQIPAEN